MWLLATVRVDFQDTTYPISFCEDESVVWQKLISYLDPPGQGRVRSSKLKEAKKQQASRRHKSCSLQCRGLSSLLVTALCSGWSRTLKV